MALFLLQAAPTLALWLCLGLPSPPVADEPWNDCNGNAVEDAVDIALGTSSDTNSDGIPDECQSLATPPPRRDTPQLERERFAPRVGRGRPERIEPRPDAERPNRTALRLPGGA